VRALEVPDQAIHKVGLLIGGRLTRPFRVATIGGDGDKLVAGAPLKEAAVGPPVVAHVNAKITRHAIEQAVPCVEPLTIVLTEGQRNQQRLKLLKVVIAQTSHRFIQGEVVGILRRKLHPQRLILRDGEAEFGCELPDLSGKDGVGALRFAFLRQGPDRLVGLETHKSFHHGNFPDLARAG
jgi:hypothetical protein